MRKLIFINMIRLKHILTEKRGVPWPPTDSDYARNAKDLAAKTQGITTLGKFQATSYETDASGKLQKHTMTPDVSPSLTPRVSWSHETFSAQLNPKIDILATKDYKYPTGQTIYAGIFAIWGPILQIPGTQEKINKLLAIDRLNAGTEISHATTQILSDHGYKPNTTTVIKSDYNIPSNAIYYNIEFQGWPALRRTLNALLSTKKK